MEKIRIQNIKTGKISVITTTAWNLLRRGNNAKMFDVIPMDKKVVEFKVENDRSMDKPIMVETPTAEEAQQAEEPNQSTEPEFLDIDSATETTETTEETTEDSPKKRGPKSNK